MATAAWAYVLIASVGCGGTSKRDTTPGRSNAEDRVVASNVLFGDYAGSDACVPCHRDIAIRFAGSAMHRMTRDAGRAEVRAPFDGDRLRLGGDVATMDTVEGQRYLHLDSDQRGREIYRVTEIIGGRYREDYVGVAVGGAGRMHRPLVDPPTRMVLPVSWMIEDGEWRYKGYSVQVPERPRMAAGPEWSKTCVFCHNTAPYLSTVFDDLTELSEPYQGSMPSNLLPDDRQLQFEVDDPAGLENAVAAEIERVVGQSLDLSDRDLDQKLLGAIRATRKRFGREHLVELGIGCESCHGGSREHVEDPRTLPSYLPRSPLLSVRAREGDLGRAGAMNHTCARCHSVLFSRYPYTWEGGNRHRDAGGSTINSGEARNFLLGGCARSMTCASCHDPHGVDDPDRLARLGTPAGNGTCTQCHEQLATERALREHAHHDPRDEGASCVGCHMPRKNAGLGYELTRYHRIGSPTDRERVEKDRPLECALCHLDETVESLVAAMERWWGRGYDRRALQRLYGPDLAVPVLQSTLARGLPHEQTVAIERLGATGDARHLSALADQLDHEYPLVRYYARESIIRITGERPPLDMSQSGDALRKEGHRWLEQREQASAPRPAKP